MEQDIKMIWSQYKSRIEQLRDMRSLQGRDGNWNYDGYMCGLFNGLELALALYEDREPDLRTLKIVVDES